jgi:hypothetical protein
MNSESFYRIGAAVLAVVGSIGIFSQRAEAAVVGIVTTDEVLDMDANISGNGTAWTPDVGSGLGTGTSSNVAPDSNAVFQSGTSSGNYYTLSNTLSGGHYGADYFNGFSGNSSSVYLTGATPFSLEQWVRPNATGGSANGFNITTNTYSAVLTGDYNSNVGYFAGLQGITAGTNPSALEITLLFRGGGTGNPVAEFTTSSVGGGVTPGVWNQLVETYTPTGGSTSNSTQVGNISFYDDGQLLETLTGVALPANGSNSEPIIPAAGAYGVGMDKIANPTTSDTTNSNGAYVGDFAINRVYAGYALTASDVQTNYQATLTAYPGIVPEPSVAVIAIGSLGFMALRRRRKSLI